jgi:hypothetical protein
LDANYSRFLQLAKREPVTSDAHEQAKAALDAASKVRQRLIQAGVVDEDTIVASSEELSLDDADQSALHLEMVGRDSNLELVWQPGQPRWAVSRAAVACGIIAMTLLIWIALQFAAARDWLAAHGHFVLAAAGIAWWLVAPFGWLGWPLVLAAAWLAVRPLKAADAYDAGSTVRRFSNSQLR